MDISVEFKPFLFCKNTQDSRCFAYQVHKVIFSEHTTKIIATRICSTDKHERYINQSRCYSHTDNNNLLYTSWYDTLEKLLEKHFEDLL